MTAAFLSASLAGDRSSADAMIKYATPIDWPFDAHVLSLRLRQLGEDPSLQPWLLRAICLPDQGLMVGCIGFHTPPGPTYLDEWAPGGIEFGFSVSSAHRRKGYALEASNALMTWASTTHGIQDFVLTISPANIESHALAAKLGFRKLGTHLDDLDGPEDILRLTFPPAT